MPKDNQRSATLSFSQYDYSNILLAKDDVLFTEDSNRWFNIFNLILITITMVPVVLGVWGYMNKDTILNEVEDTTIDVSNEYNVSNEYPSESGDLKQSYPWLEDFLLAEPYRISKLSLAGTLLGKDDSDIVWLIEDENGDVIEKLEGPSPTFTFTKLSKHKITAIEQSEDGEVLQRVSANVVVKYVRREIRSLNEDDLKTLLDTMEIMWKLPQEEGEALYGSDYKSIVELLVFHLKFSGDRKCDHIHDGFGFLTQHSALTNLFERSLQAINPSISLPYWDYIQDVEAFQNQGLTFTDFVNSELFSEKFFGATDPETGYIIDGRWEGLKIPTMNDVSESEWGKVPHNMFNQLRSPWNTNQDPHITRFSTNCDGDPGVVFDMPTCEVLNTLMNKQSVKDFLSYISDDPHGPVHVFTGGAQGCGDAYDTLQGFMDEEDVNIHRAKSFLYHRNAYRTYQIECNEEYQGCSCVDEDSIYESETNLANFFDAVGVDNWEKYSDDAKDALVQVICNSNLYLGDNLQSSSSYTPEFWFIHPTVERAFQYKVSQYPFKDYSYPEDSSWPGDSICKGHSSHDFVLFATADQVINNEALTLTNAEMLKVLDPNLDILPYVYDSLDWHYCVQGSERMTGH